MEFDNWFAFSKLISLLSSVNILTICIVHGDRIGSAPITSKTQMERSPYGNYSYAFDDSVSPYCNHWKEVSVVALPSTCIGSYSPQKVERYLRKDQRNVQVSRSKLIKTYNSTMGGVDLVDGAYGSQIKMKK